MQSWQADLLNLSLRTSVKPLFRRARSIPRIRQAMHLFDSSVGRLLQPRGTRTAPATRALACACEWVDFDASRKARKARVILYLPGGAYIIRTPRLHAGMVARLCREADARALICHYRLAPEHPFPACLDDAVAAYDWLLAQGWQPGQIVIAGDSAGGGLTLATLLALRQRGRPQPAAAVMLSPLLDAGDTAASRIQNARSDAALPHPAQRGINPRPLFLAGEDPKNPLVSPIYGEYDGLPSMYVLVSDSEMLLDDSLRLARRAQLYGVEVRVDIFRKLPHVWPAIPLLPESAEALARAGRFVSERTAGAAPAHGRGRGRRPGSADFAAR